MNQKELFLRLERAMRVLAQANLDTPEKAGMHKDAITILASIFEHLNQTGEPLYFHIEALFRICDKLE